MSAKWKAYQLHAFYSEHIRKLRILIQQLVKYERLLLTPRRAEILKKEANLVRIYFLTYYPSLSFGAKSSKIIYPPIFS